MEEQKENKEGYEYIDGDLELPTIGKNLIRCGQCVGWFKSWLPCLGCCFCCCNEPYVHIPQGSVGLFTQFGKYIKTCKSGLHYVNPLAEEIIMMDCKISVLDIPIQKLMTKDGIPIAVDSCAYYHISHPHLGHYRGTSMDGPIKKVVGRMIKNTITHFTFQELLEKRNQITDDIMRQAGPIIALRGLVIDRICIKNFSISRDLEKDLTSAAIARRNAQSKIITAQGQVEVARMINEGAHILDSKTAIQVRYLQTLEKLGRNKKTHMIYRSQ